MCLQLFHYSNAKDESDILTSALVLGRYQTGQGGTTSAVRAALQIM